MTRLLALDPGSEETGFVIVDAPLPPHPPATWIGATRGWTIPCAVIESGKEPNPAIRPRVASLGIDLVVIEWTAPRGMPASAQLFETLYWAGRFAEVGEGVGTRVVRLTRAEVKRRLCGTTAAKDTNVRAALVDLFGGTWGKEAAVGRKASPGPLYGVRADAWAALGLAVAWLQPGS